MSINGKNYDWEDITVRLPHGEAILISDISYSDGQGVAPRYGKGGIPRGYGRQNYEATGSMTIDLEEFERLAGNLGESIYDHDPFTINVSYSNSKQTVTDKLNKVKITKLSTSNSQGSENAGQKSIEFTILEPIVYNGKKAKK